MNTKTIFVLRYKVVFELKGTVDISEKIKCYEQLNDAVEFANKYNTLDIKHRELIHYDIFACPLGLTIKQGNEWRKVQEEKGNLIK